jgi:hypothetical protein
MFRVSPALCNLAGRRPDPCGRLERSKQALGAGDTGPEERMDAYRGVTRHVAVTRLLSRWMMLCRGAQQVEEV